MDAWFSYGVSLLLGHRADFDLHYEGHVADRLPAVGRRRSAPQVFRGSEALATFLRTSSDKEALPRVEDRILV